MADVVKDLVEAVHEALLQQDKENLGQEDTYYLDAVNQYAVDQDTESLEAAAGLLEQNILESYLDDLVKLCAEVLRERVKPAVIPDDGP
jgi:hypothetical protein